MIILGLAESIETMNRLDPTMTLSDDLFLKVMKDRRFILWNFDTIFLQVFHLHYKNLESIPLTARILCFFSATYPFRQFSTVFFLS